jgi:hypothetical protein
MAPKCVCVLKRERERRERERRKRTRERKRKREQREGEGKCYSHIVTFGKEKITLFKEPLIYQNMVEPNMPYVNVYWSGK